MKETLDKERKKRSSHNRHGTQQTRSNPVHPGNRRQRTLVPENASSKEISLPGSSHPRANDKPEVRCGNESINTRRYVKRRHKDIALDDFQE